MKIKTIINWTPVCVLCIIIIISLYSWIGNVYELGVNNLLNADGIRWITINAVPNILKAPIDYVLLTLVTISVIQRSGILLSFKPNASLKQKRSLSLSILVFAIIAIVYLFLLFFPPAVLLSSFGTIENSPFLKGLFGILCFTFIVSGDVFGISSGRFIAMKDTIAAHVALIKDCATYFLTMILVAGLLACLNYTGILPETNSLYDVVYWLLYLIPLGLEIWDRFYWPNSAN